MHKLIFASIAITLLIIIPAFASGEVYIPDHEYVGFYDHDGIFTVIGGVKNNEMYPVIPTITVSVNDDGNVFFSGIQIFSGDAGSNVAAQVKTSTDNF